MCMQKRALNQTHQKAIRRYNRFAEQHFITNSHLITKEGRANGPSVRLI